MATPTLLYPTTETDIYQSCLPIVASAHEVAVVGGEGETGLAQEEPSGEGATTWHVVVILVISLFPISTTKISFVIAQKNYPKMSPSADEVLCIVPAISRVSVGQCDGWNNLW